MNDHGISGSLARYDSTHVKPKGVSVKLKSLPHNDG